MNVRAIGEDAVRFADRVARGDGDAIVAEPAFAQAALAAAVELRRGGTHFASSLIWPDQPTRVARTKALTLAVAYDTWDEVRLMLQTFADSIDAHARYPISAEDRAALHEFVRLSDLLIVRSHAERGRIEAALGTIPVDVDVVVVGPPALVIDQAERTDVVVYAPHERGSALGMFVTALGDLTLPVTIVARDAPRIASPLRFVAPEMAAAALGRARVIVDAGTDDPGMSRSLAALGVPLAVSSRSGATEVLRDVATFEPWNRISIVAAVADALGASRARVRTRQPPESPELRATIHAEPAPLVSVVVTTFNRRVVLADTLATIERQSYAALEIVVVNDAGCDVADVVARFPRARLIDRAQNGGPAAARNTGMHAARGAFIIFFDDDDEMFPDHVATLAGALERSGLDVAYGQMLNAFASTDANGHYHADAFLAHDAVLDHAEIQWAGSLATTAVMFRRSIVGDVGDVDERLGANEDFEFWMRLAAGREWARVPDVTSLYFVRTDGSNRSNADTRERYTTAHQAIFQKHPSTRALVNAGRASILQLFRGTAAPV